VIYMIKKNYVQLRLKICDISTMPVIMQQLLKIFSDRIPFRQ